MGAPGNRAHTDFVIPAEAESGLAKYYRGLDAVSRGVPIWDGGVRCGFFIGP
jgi:hypothetical protein